MKVFIIGGTGLLGSSAAKMLLDNGNDVASMALLPIPNGLKLDKRMQLIFEDYSKIDDNLLENILKDYDSLVFAAGIDERVEGHAPIYELFKKYNITDLERLIVISKKAGIKHVVVLGSYFSYFAKMRKKAELIKWHPYIRSRIDQENMCLSYASENFDISVLELPYIFGIQSGRKPVWTFLVENIKRMKLFTLYPKGGTTMVTVNQVSQAICGALEKNKGGNSYPIGYYNMSWKEFLFIVHKAMGLTKRKVITIPKWMFKIGARSIMKKQRIKNHEGGLNMVKFADLQCSNQFIDKSLGAIKLGVQDDDIEKAIIDSIKMSLDVINKKTITIDMKGEI